MHLSWSRTVPVRSGLVDGSRCAGYVSSRPNPGVPGLRAFPPPACQRPFHHPRACCASCTPPAAGSCVTSAGCRDGVHDGVAVFPVVPCRRLPMPCPPVMHPHRCVSAVLFRGAAGGRGPGSSPAVSRARPCPGCPCADRWNGGTGSCREGSQPTGLWLRSFLPGFPWGLPGFPWVTAGRNPPRIVALPSPLRDLTVIKGGGYGALRHLPQGDAGHRSRPVPVRESPGHIQSRWTRPSGPNRLHDPKRCTKP